MTQRGRGRYFFWIHTLSPPPDFELGGLRDGDETDFLQNRKLVSVKRKDHESVLTQYSRTHANDQP